ncbi:transporter substrate-binding domain-containing protein [Pseudomonas putida]|uniref:substrate-binding periplasmic protein n=1 Tax=Pseudomonas putida TaxID=303 RepID=UPI002363E2AF|nr:transporter substrate-binding domain-containing protein [Pseudomonas putida]MDD1966592.1 transporter substrate-binding domain-containing protein [Pseudomonas putida]
MPVNTERALSGGWISYSLAVLIGGAAVCAVWLLPLLDAAEQAPGPLLERAKEQHVLRIGVRSYPRPTYSTEALVSEPDEMDSELAQALGRYLGLEVQLAAIPSQDLAGFLNSGKVDAVIAGSADVAGLEKQRASLRAVPDAFEHGALVSLRNAPQSSIAGQSVCAAFGSPWIDALHKQHAQVRTYASGIRAATAFLSGDCAFLADERTVLTSLLQTPDWRFYRLLPQTLEASSDARVYLAQADSKSLRLLQAGLRHWQSEGGQARAWDLRSNAYLVDSMKISDGLVCH